ncbi:DUF4129 domain-containing protein [Dactylosporangium siamense]|uniref:Protein-glutamine gamma-glutamyltransferase-like C-terminal domain-containing protein n=1 Tax=Dactylosporangium siamense TaxID=685454 RepID=A0A919PIW2_9ACTN|nr:DUF4129 domain-containing protein [Dactylosporangium siamense]GIG43340.1 hypothetical protein Dsi01nite_013810 [Dactylosporangium siamense]
MDRTFNRWLPVLAVIAALGVAAVAAATSSPEINKLPVPPLDQSPPVPSDLPTSTAVATLPPPPAAEQASSYEFPEWVTYTAGVLCVLLLVIAAGVLIWSLLRNGDPKRKARLFVEPKRPAQLTDDGGAAVIAAVEAGLVELSDTDTDPRKAVIACWVRLERAAAAAGTPRETGDSPTDLVTRLLAGHQISRPTLEGLAFVYREARYATHPVDERSRQGAIEALRQLRAELALRGGAVRGA